MFQSWMLAPSLLIASTMYLSYNFTQPPELAGLSLRIALLEVAKRHGLVIAVGMFTVSMAMTWHVVLQGR